MHEEVYHKWKEYLAGFWSSGLTLAEYCRQHNLNSKTAGRWKNTFLKEGIDHLRPLDKLDIVQLNVKELSRQQQSSGVILELGEIRIELEKDFDSKTLKQVLSLLEVN